jgi:monoamine oxidase
MPRTPLMTWLGRAARDAAEQANREAGPVQRRTSGQVGSGDWVTRRHVLRAGVLGAGALTAARLGAGRSANAAPASAAGTPRLVVVGAGLAGLTAAHELRKAGYRPTLVEASTRIGGRCWSYNHGELGDRLVAEHGGELIDQGHTQIRQLVQELGLELDNLLSAETNGTEQVDWFLGQRYSYQQATKDIKAIWQTLHKDVSAASYPTLFDYYTQRGWELDHTSVYDYIEQVVPGGHGSPLGLLLDVAYNIEYGGETTAQSSLNLLYLLAYSGQGQLRVFGPSNEKYHVRGGNDLIVRRLAEILGDTIVVGAPLQSIVRNSDGTYRLGFAGTPALTADHVVLALPFSLLRQVDYSRAGFDAIKQKAIAALPMGTNSKLQVRFDRRLWRDQGCNGETFADLGYQNSWEVSRAQPGTAGILVNYTGGTIGATFSPANGTAAQRAAQFIQQISPVIPGLAGAWDGRTAAVDYWTGYPWTLGSYSYWKVGQYTGFSGAEKLPSGTCHFAGEHTSQDFQGYLNGAVETGQRAAGEILAALR